MVRLTQGEVALQVGLEIAPATWSTFCVILMPPHMSPTVALGASEIASTDAAVRQKQRANAKCMVLPQGGLMGKEVQHFGNFLEEKNITGFLGRTRMS